MLYKINMCASKTKYNTNKILEIFRILLKQYYSALSIHMMVRGVFYPPSPPSQKNDVKSKFPQKIHYRL